MKRMRDLRRAARGENRRGNMCCMCVEQVVVWWVVVGVVVCLVGMAKKSDGMSEMTAGYGGAAPELAPEQQRCGAERSGRLKDDPLLFMPSMVFAQEGEEAGNEDEEENGDEQRRAGTNRRDTDDRRAREWVENEDDIDENEEDERSRIYEWMKENIFDATHGHDAELREGEENEESWSVVEKAVIFVAQKYALPEFAKAADLQYVGIVTPVCM